jgi:leader peptidase (prepilin peptidase)/N-methyltransferase
MNELIYLAIGTLGAILGSFASAVIPRIKEKQDFVRSRSECPACHHELGTLDLFPIVSYILLLGKCRYCKATIPPYHFLLELSMTGGFLLVATQLVNISAIASVDMAEICTLIFLLISMFVTIVFSAYDLLYWEIPDEFMIPFLIITFFLLA